MSAPNDYEVPGDVEKAANEAIYQAFRQLERAYTPEQHLRREEAEQYLNQIDQAYETLINLQIGTSYDRQLWDLGPDYNGSHPGKRRWHAVALFLFCLSLGPAAVLYYQGILKEQWHSQTASNAADLDPALVPPPKAGSLSSGSRRESPKSDLVEIGPAQPSASPSRQTFLPADGARPYAEKAAPPSNSAAAGQYKPTSSRETVGQSRSTSNDEVADRLKPASGSFAEGLQSRTADRPKKPQSRNETENDHMMPPDPIERALRPDLFPRDSSDAAGAAANMGKSRSAPSPLWGSAMAASALPLPSVQPKPVVTNVAASPDAYALPKTAAAVTMLEPNTEEEARKPTEGGLRFLDNGLILARIGPAGADAPWTLKPGGGETGTFQDCDQCPVMTVLPAGSFLMGSPEREDGREQSEGPQQYIRIKQPFAVSKFEITAGEWSACAAEGPCRPNRASYGRFPAINVSWNDAKSFVQWLSHKTGKTYRLLSEAEWEYAARARTSTPYWWGRWVTAGQVVYNGTDALGRTLQLAAVNSRKPNPWGLYHMLGNVAEWVEDCWHETYDGLPLDGSPWLSEQGGDCSQHVLRGGSVQSGPGAIRAAARSKAPADLRARVNGFRVARSF